MVWSQLQEAPKRECKNEMPSARRLPRLNNIDKGFKPVTAESLSKTVRRKNLPPRQSTPFKKCGNSLKVAPAAPMSEDHVSSSVLNCTISAVSPVFQPPLKELKSQQEAPSSCRKRECRNKMPSSTDKERPKSSELPEVPPQMPNRAIYETGPPAWFMKEIRGDATQLMLAVKKKFCKKIGLKKSCKITLKTPNGGSWEVNFLSHEHSRTCHLSKGWPRFHSENGIEKSDWCTFHIKDSAEPRVWDVVNVGHLH